MLVAVVHSDGAQAARELIARTAKLAGPPQVVASIGQGALAGWSGAAPVTLASDGLLEGWLDVSFREGPFGWDFDERIATARGDFALIALACGGLVAASGPSGGHRPVFVLTQSKWAAASTRVRALLALMDSRPPLDIDFLAASAVVDSPLSLSSTPYRGVHHVPLGQAWLVRAGMSAQSRSTLLDLPHAEVRGSDGENAAMLRHTIESAVIRATRGASKIGVTLSGGLDSSSVLATLDSLRRAGRVSTEVEAFSWEFDTPDRGDDRPYRRSMERRLGIHSNRIAPEEAGQYVRRGMVLDAMPCTDCPCALWLALDRAAERHHIDRLLTGAGGDNVLEGDPLLLGELARRGSPLQALRRAIRLRVGHTSPWWRLGTFVLRPIVGSMTPEPLKALYRRRRERRWFDWMGPRFDDWIRERTAIRSSPVARVTLDSSPAERYTALACMPFLGEVVLLRSQQEEATHCHRSDPLFDDAVLRVVASFPSLALFAGDYVRGLLREAMADLLPADVKTRRRKAYLDPALARMVRASGGLARFEDLAQVRRLADLGLVEPRAFRKHFDRLRTHPLDGVWSSAWPALAVEEFLRQYDDGWDAGRHP